ncbi:Bidirectional sugar transporter SWEET2 [Hibiscus syriacus]|uniref:Bidirectional sugar transporter SWEET n=1 Tax=Hibiscus syriacus TaxID=106335 RepID=A0A6A3A6J5_HIBSY|nr:bidirectional sugar transporter SWEET2a-like [Hibiscus syriacus]KAE8699347.1 Bidirectional sugar transporter SWEET2 [Hibiscus syriacus]
MYSTVVFSVYAVCSDAAGVAGNIFAFVLFLSPISTFRRIIRNGSTEQFSGMPYMYAFLNCLICLWYGLPFVSPGIILVATVNSIGAIFQLIYIGIFVVYAEKPMKLKMLGFLVSVSAIFAAVVFVSLKFLDAPSRKLFVGYLSVASLISMFASPLLIINLVMKTRSVEYMPFSLSLATFMMSLAFFVYGMLKHDAFLYVPNGIGTGLGTLQLALYTYFNNASRGELKHPLIGP